MQKDPSTGTEPEILTAAHFAERRGGAFRVEGWAHSLLLRDIQASSGDSSFRAPFNLIFEGPRHDVLPEGLRRLIADNDAAYDLYLIPIRTIEADRQNYQAAFN